MKEKTAKGDKESIVLFEDEPSLRKGLSLCLEHTFSKYQIISNIGGENCIYEVLETSRGLEKIAMVITDGNLGGGLMGWEIAEKLRQKGYKKPIIYYGATKLPADKTGLFNKTSSKYPDQLIELLQEYIK